MDTSAFICALRRFFALRGHAKLLRCDRGTNFVGAKTELKDASSELNEEKVKKFVTESGCEWELNPPPPPRITLWRSLGKANQHHQTSIGRHVR